MRAHDPSPQARAQRGFFLIEVLVAILILALGILGLVAMGGMAVNTQSDSQYRAEASNLADSIAAQIAVGVDRTNAATLQTSLAAFVHQPTVRQPCEFTGAVATRPEVVALTDRAANATSMPGLPGATAANQQVIVDTAAFNRVEITLCWKTASDLVMRRHTLVTFVN